MKMSDALRAAAESAPVDEVHVSTGAAARRVRRTRAVRTGANGLAGVGAAAIIFAGVMGVVANQGGVAANADVAGGDSGDGSKMDIQSESGGAPQAVPAAGPDAVLSCGQSPVDLNVLPEGQVVAEVPTSEVGDAVVTYTIAYTASATATLDLAEPTVYALWDGVVVGIVGSGAYGPWDATEGAVVEHTTEAQLINCWDGAALPAGDYLLWSTTPVTGDEGNLTYALAGFNITVPGDPVDNPFGKYLDGSDPLPTEPTPDNPIEPAQPTQPADLVSPTVALDAYNAALTNSRWDMAKGTQRVVLTSSSQSNGDDWAKGYYGCPSDGAGTSFPAESADLDWLGVDVDAPSRINVSYGWVVDDNPLITATYTNRSDWTLPGFYAGTTPALYLVKDGKVVAQAYPVTTNQQGAVAYATDGILSSTEGTSRLIAPPVDDGYLSPGKSIGGSYLWRDISGCWNGNTQTAVKPGTYTLLTSQDLFMSNAMVYPLVEPAMEFGDGSSGAATDSAAVAPAPNQDEYASFQVWTSLGTVKVTS